MRVLVCGGGSIGHIAPGVAVLRALQVTEPNVKALFVCSDRNEEHQFLEKEAVEFRSLPLLKRNLTLPMRLLRANRLAKSIMQEFRPDVVFSKGGAVSFPVARAAFQANIPIVLHESDAVIGRANRVIARYASVLCYGFPLTEKQARDSVTQLYTGNPVRPEVLEGSRERGLKLARFSGKRPVLLVMGGSQGAQALNDIVHRHLETLTEFCDVLHLTGRGKEGETMESHGYFARAFAHGDLPHFYAAADIAVSRSGAGSIAELAANGIPSIFVPLRGLAQDHQLLNAEAALKSGGCLLVEQEVLATSLTALAKELCLDGNKRKQMSEKIQRLWVPDAAEHIARIVKQATVR